MEEMKRLLEDVLVAQVVTLARQLEVEARKGGTTRIGGDYIPEALRLLEQKRTQVLDRLR